MGITREHCAGLDAADALASARDRFILPAGVIYLDGNSLGPLAKSVAPRLRQAVEQEWGDGLIRSWNDAGWIDAPRRVARRIAPLIGADADEVIVADSTSVNLFKLLAAALRLKPARRVILTEADNFPTDLYIMQGIADLSGAEVRYAGPEPGALMAALDGDVAVLALTHVNYKSGLIHPMRELSAAAHAAGALALWDLSHSAGSVELDVAQDGADLAAGCGYKYLNGGPGAPAYAYVAKRHQAQLRQPLSGWFGHAQPFAFARDFEPAAGMQRMLSGTPPVLALIALEAALEAFDGIDLAALRRKGRALGDLFIALVDEKLADTAVRVASPRDAVVRGSQVSLSHAQGYAVMQALIARGVIGDFRAPDLMRFGFAPLYLRYVDIFDTVDALAGVLAGGEWMRPEFSARKAAT
jgi:kynureninase